MAQQALVSGDYQPFGSARLVRSAFSKADENFDELYDAFALSFSVPSNGSKTVYNLFIARAGYQVLSIDYVPDTAQGSALTACVVKASGTATPSTGTTPMQSSITDINLNGTAHTVQSIGLTATTANLLLAAGDRIALVLSGAMTTGSGCLTIRLKPV